MGKAIFFVKQPSLIQILVKALEAVEDGQKSPCFKYLSIIFFFVKTKFFERFFYHNTTPVGFLLDFDLHLVYFIMQN